MRALAGRVLDLVPTRRAAVALFLAAFVVYWIESTGWPMAKGRDTWDYLAYYLQLFDSDPPFSQLQLFRTPLTPVVVGLPLDLGGVWLLEFVFACLYATSVVAWSKTALVFGRIPALFSALLLLVYPAYATLYHQASSDAVFATGLALWALLLARAMDRPTRGRFVAVGAGIGLLVLVRPANQVLLPLAVVAPMVAYVAWRRRLALAAVCVVAAVLPLALWAVHNGVRYDDTTVARGGRAWVPFLQVFTSNRTISPENGTASERLASLIEQEVLSRDPHASLDVTLDAYLANGSNYETVRLIALSDTVLGRSENYGVLFDSATEAIRAHPGVYFRGVADTFWEFMRQKPLAREHRATRSDGAHGASSDVRLRRQCAAEPAGHRPRRRRPVWLRLVRVRLHRLLHAPSMRRRPSGILRRRSGIGRSSRVSVPGTPSSRPGQGRVSFRRFSTGSHRGFRHRPSGSPSGSSLSSGDAHAVGARSSCSGRPRSWFSSSTRRLRVSHPSSSCRCTPSSS